MKGTTLALSLDVSKEEEHMKKLFYLSPPEKRRAAKTLVEVVGWLVAILLFIYASHAALA